MPIIIHIPMKISRFKIPQCSTKSALDRNFKASASSRKPNTILTEFSQPPDFGREFIHPGNKANRAKGNARAKPKPPMPTVSCTAPPFVDKDPASNEPSMGPVQENETSANVSAIKNIPIKPPAPDLASAEFAMLLGKVISNNPKKERAKTMKMTKKKIFSQTLVDILFK